MSEGPDPLGPGPVRTPWTGAPAPTNTGSAVARAEGGRAEATPPRGTATL